ncbi:MAG: DUF6252 family protein [Flavobacteriales bacterium]
MKKLLILSFVFTFCFSCDDIEDNTPGFQANLEGIFFKANDSKGIRRQEGSYTIQGITNDKILTLKVERSAEGTYELGPNSANFATFENENGAIYTTSVEGGNGVITISRKNTGQLFFNGTFHFIAINPGIDTLVVDQGVFYQVPYDFNPIIDEDGENQNIADLFVANVDGIVFNPFTILATTDGTSINILAASPNKEISLKIPEDAQTGNYPIPGNGYSAKYKQDGSEETANSGNIIIIENDLVERRVTGTFSFETNNHTISLGQFRINY